MWPLSTVLSVAAIVLAALAMLDVIAATTGLALAVIAVAASQLVGGRLFHIGK